MQYEIWVACSSQDRIANYKSLAPRMAGFADAAAGIPVHAQLSLVQNLL